MGQVLLKIASPDALTGPAILFGNALQLLGARYIASKLSNPGDLSDLDRVLYFTKCVLPFLALLQWLTFEFQAMVRVPINAKPWQTNSNDQNERNPPFMIKVVRVAQNSFEQSIVTFAINLSLVLYLPSTNAAGVDFRIAIANMFLYIASRPFFGNFYLAHPELRFFPLMVGGFWVNAGLALYAVLMACGCVADSNLLWHACTIGCPAIILLLIVAMVPANQDKKSK
jgi:hypothetical protein